jgi:myo-inositol-hexaphosphate 3-phosphohydrolase
MKTSVVHLPSCRLAVILLAILVVLSLSRPAVKAANPFPVLPVLETPQTLDTDEPVPAGVLQGDSDDPAIWVHPTNPEASLVLGRSRRQLAAESNARAPLTLE